MKPLRIAIALPGLHRVNRGAETALEQIARELANLGNHVTVFGSGSPRAGEPYKFVHLPAISREHFEHYAKFPILRSHYAWEEMTFAPGLLAAFRGHFDVTLGCSYPFVHWILRRKGKHIFITQNGDWMVHARNAEYRFFDCDGLVCTNPQYFDRNRERFPSTLIPNGVDDSIFHPGKVDRAQFGLPENRPVVLMVSALIPSKYVLDGIAAASENPDVFLIIAGDGEMRDQVEGEGKRLMPGRFQRLSLPRAKMPDLYRAADIFLHMSRDEPSANAYMEALATGLPIITHDWEVTRWTLEDCGILVDTANRPLVTEAISRAISMKDPAPRRALVARRFTWKSIGRQYQQFIENILVPISNETKDSEKLADLGIVAIGRNEGDRLLGCLNSAKGKAAAMVYVDSGSTDGSVRAARVLGATVVELDRAVPFTAARARNAGLAELMKRPEPPAYVQFVDGDCEIQGGWLTMAANALRANSKLAVVCGRRRERFPGASIYNRLCDIEWNTPVGPAKSCGGDAMMRTDVLKQTGSFNPEIIAGEEPELCVRIRAAGFAIERLNAEMTLHDADIMRLSQWWRRTLRSGHACAEGYARHGSPPERFNQKAIRSIVFWGMIVPVLFAAIALAGIWSPRIWLIDVFLIAGYFTLMARVFWRRPVRGGFAYAFFTVLGKFPQALGALKYFFSTRSGKKPSIIEYKSPA